jgi:hypothetical protein
MAKIKRSQIATFVNTTPSSTNPTWSLLGPGVTTGKAAMNPKTTEETYIHEETATITVDSYAPTMPVEMTPVTGDAVWEYVDTLRLNRAVLSEAETQIVNVWKYKTSTGGSWPAEKQSVSVQIDDAPGGDGGTPAKVSFTFNYLGAGSAGGYYPASSSFGLTT